MLNQIAHAHPYILSQLPCLILGCGVKRPIRASAPSLQKGIPPDISEVKVLEVEVKFVHTRRR
jgi:hypothetical protein